MELVPGGQTVLITSKRDGNTSRVQMTHIGIQLEDFRVIVCKGYVAGAKFERGHCSWMRDLTFGMAYVTPCCTCVCHVVRVNSPIAAYEPLTPGAANGM